MKYLARKIFKSVGNSDYEIPDYKQIEDTQEAKKVMKEYLEKVIKENEKILMQKIQLKKQQKY